ncbi:MAG TPA: sugar ABC transporter ATP-binding protein [Mycobacteriales bacterium]|nr:sugar ABC transporter ATP-binding protein [Mycobacteriales bacterium]
MFEAKGVSKRYGGVVALHPTDFAVAPGTVHALLGENGAGKSTVVKILTGSIAPDTGDVLQEGQPVRLSTTADAARRGVAVVSQELNLFPELSVLANLFVNREPRRAGGLDRTVMRRRAEPVLDEVGVSLKRLDRPLGDLTLADQQLVEIARALLVDPTVLVLYEPTSALEAVSTDNLMRIVGALRARGTGVVFVSHILEEVLSVSDEVTVLRDGRTVLSRMKRRDVTIASVVEAMLGDRPDSSSLPRPVAAVAPAAEGGSLRVDRVPVVADHAPVSLDIPPGEIVGLAGLLGAGHQEVLRLAAGFERPQAGHMLLPDGTPVPRPHRASVAAGIALVSGDRRATGLMLDKSLWENIAQVRSVALRRDGVLIRRRQLRERAAEQARRLTIKARSVDSSAGSLSGGNQQKVVFAKWLELEPQILLLDDPTRGVDTGAKDEMHRLIRAIAEQGAVVLLCSTDNKELVDLCHRVVVFYRGEVAGELTGEGLAIHRLLEAVNTGVIEAAA